MHLPVLFSKFDNVILSGELVVKDLPSLATCPSVSNLWGIT